MTARIGLQAALLGHIEKASTISICREGVKKKPCTKNTTGVDRTTLSDLRKSKLDRGGGVCKLKANYRGGLKEKA